MSRIQKITAGGATFEQLIQFVEECKGKGISSNTPVKIAQHTSATEQDVVDMQGDDVSIIFYDWI